jgi:hypothetical protein
MKAVVHLLHAIDKISFLGAVLRNNSTTVALSRAAHHHAVESILFKQPLARPLLVRLFRYIRLMFQLVREKVVGQLAHGREGSPAFDETQRGARAVAYHLAMAHEVTLFTSSFCVQ